MKKILLLLSLVVLISLVGCQQVAEQAMEANLEAETGGDVEVDISEGEMTIETEEGTIHMETTEANTGHWCQEGTEWQYAAAMTEGNTNAQMTVEGLIDFGEYEGLCHVVYVAEGPDGDAQMDYYFSEDGESGYFEMNVNGEVMKSQWSK
jgi:hypothetical protein